jgi:hypothetical protein
MPKNALDFVLNGNARLPSARNVSGAHALPCEPVGDTADADAAQLLGQLDAGNLWFGAVIG